MKRGKNFNHPKKGSQIRVEPVRTLEAIEAIKSLIYDKPLDYALFVVGINTNLRASDLLRIKVSQVKELKANDEIELREKKTKKLRRINLNDSCIQAIKRLLESKYFKDDDDLFKGQRGTITVSGLNHKVKDWCKTVGLKGNYGSHSLRKTWGYNQRVTFGVELPILMECLNHSNQKQTMTYLCIQPEEIKQVYRNEL